MGRMVKHMKGSRPRDGYMTIDEDSLPLPDCSCSVCNGVALRRSKGRSTGSIGQSSYGQGSRSGGYGQSTFSMRAGEFDGMPSLSRRRSDGAVDIFFQEGSVDMNDPTHGHAVIRDGRLVYKRMPGDDNPIVDRQ